MSASKKPALPTAAEVRAQIERAEHAFLAATVALGEALVVQQALPDRDVSPEQTAADDAKRRVENLKAMLPIIERAEHAALEETRGKLNAEQRKQLERALRDLLKQAQFFGVHYANAASAFRRMTKAGADVEKLLFPHQRDRANGHLPGRLSAAGLHNLCVQEINRVGLEPEHAGVSAPGTNPATVSLRYRNAAHHLRSIEHEIRSLSDLILATAPGAPEGEDSSGSPEPAEQPSPQPAPPAEASGADATSEDI